MTRQDIITELRKYDIDATVGEHEVLVWAKLHEDADEDGFELDICLIDGELVIDPQIACQFEYTLDEITIVEII